jgi:fatty acid desaturase
MPIVRRRGLRPVSNAAVALTFAGSVAAVVAVPSDLARDDAAGPEPSLGRDFHDLRVDAATELSNLGYLALSWGAVAAAVGAFWKRRTPLTAAAAIAVIASRQQALLNVEHDALHRTLARDRRVNDAVGIVAAAAPCGSGFRATRAQHLRHHRYLNTPNDPDAILHRGPHLDTRSGLLRHLAEGFTGIYALKVLRRREGWIGPDARRKDKRDLVLVNLGLWGLFTRLTAWWTYPLLWLAPLTTITSGVVVIRNYVDHALVGEELDEYPDRRVSVDPSPVEGTNISPNNMNWHAEHHLFPWVPARRLPEAARRLAARPDGPAELVRTSYLRALASHLKRLP